MPNSAKQEIGLAVIGCGTIGRIRAKLARDYPGVGWIGLCDLKSDLGAKLKEDVDADFFTNDFKRADGETRGHRSHRRDGREFPYRPDTRCRRAWP